MNQTHHSFDMTANSHHLCARQSLDASRVYHMIHFQIQRGGDDMIYRIIVDGIRKDAYAKIEKYSLEADNLAREAIIRHYLDEAGAGNVVIETTPDEVRRLCEMKGS